MASAIVVVSSLSSLASAPGSSTEPPLRQEGHREREDYDRLDTYVDYGNNVPVAPYNFVGLTQDESNGNVLVTIRIHGRVRWKVGAFVSGRYHIYVRCPAYISWGSRSSASAVGDNAVKYQLVQRCSVSVRSRLSSMYLQ